jgi:hypothetical protein
MSCCVNSLWTASILALAKGFSGSDEPITIQDFMLLFFDISKYRV